MNTSLTMLRRIDPPALLLKQLTDIGHAITFENGTVWVDDDRPRDVALNQTITGWYDKGNNFIPGCTVGYGIFDGDYNELGFYRDRAKASRAMDLAKPRIITEFELEQEDEVAPESKPKSRKPFES